MTDVSHGEFWVDPHLNWPGGFPYDVVNRQLAQAGAAPLSPMSTGREVLDAMYSVMGREARDALDQLRHPSSRMCVDFFMYACPPAPNSPFDPTLWERPVPFEVPDFTPLAVIPIDYNAAIEVPARVEGCPSPGPVLPAEPLTLPPIDLGPLPPSVPSFLQGFIETGPSTP
jgi:hypothetical protein